MDLRWVWPIMAVALVGALWLPVGDKSVHLAECSGDWRSYHCSHTHWAAEYELFRLGTEKRTYSSGSAEAYPTGGKFDTWAYHYTDEDAPHADGITFMLPVGGLLMLVTGATATVAGYAALIRRSPATRLIAVSAWGAMAIAIACFLLGMAWHAYTWRGADVESLRPGWGMLAVAAALLNGVPLLPQKERDVMPSLPGPGDAT